MREPQLIDRVITLLRQTPDGTWILDNGAERRLVSLLDVVFSQNKEQPGDVEELLKLVHVLETKHASAEAAGRLVSIMKSIPRLLALVRDQFGATSHARQAAAAFAWFQGGRPSSGVKTPPATKPAGGVSLSSLTRRFDSLEARRAKSDDRTKSGR